MKQRMKDASEGPSSSGNVQRSYPVITCSRCGLKGNHNRFGCTNQGVMPMPPNWIPPPPPPNNEGQGEQVTLDLSQSAPQTQEQLFDVNSQGT